MMQTLKDSFYVALRDRLAALDPARTGFIGGQTRPALVVRENEAPAASPDDAGVFYLEWNELRTVAGTQTARRPLMALTCAVHYSIEGSESLSYQDRGRLLATMDEELLTISSPAKAPSKDFSSTPATDLGATIVWTRPTFEPLRIDGKRLSRTASLQVMAFSEVDLT